MNRISILSALAGVTSIVLTTPSVPALATSPASSASASTTSARRIQRESTPTPGDGHDHGVAQQMGGVTVSASTNALGTTPVTPSISLSGVDLDRARAGTIGETVANEPGIQTTSLGTAVGRPVIHGMGGPRVGVAENGIPAGDVSAISQDHAVTVEPFLADSVQVLKGPATLVYGSGAIGGVVNSEDGRIPDHTPADGFSGRASLQYDSVSSGNTDMFRLDGGNDHVVMHADAVQRNDHDYDTPQGTLDNSWVDTTTGAIGASALGDWGYIGFSIARYMDEYGSPVEPGNPAEGEDPVHLKMDQTRYQVKGRFPAPLPGLRWLQINAGRTEYEHTEYKGDTPETTFTNAADQWRAMAKHDALGGWIGTFGLQHSKSNFAALSEESFIPPTRTSHNAVFLLEHRDWGNFDLQVGGRSDRQRIHARGHGHQHHTANSFSAAGGWTFADNWKVSLNLTRSQRAPVEEELYAHGPHEGSATYEIGSPDLGVETANQATVKLRYRSNSVDASVSIYRNRFDDFIYLADTGNRAAGFPIRIWSQHDALFHGFDAEATVHLMDNASGDWDLHVQGDRVRARMRHGGGNLPRIPAVRAGSDLDWQRGDMHATVGATRYFAQNHNAINETRTDGFTQVHLDFGWTFHNTASNQWEIFVQGKNLTNQTARMATSLFKEEAPRPGRNISTGIRAWF